MSNDETFVHDGWQVVMILNENGQVKDRYLWGTKQDELLCKNDEWMLGDHLGTVRDVIDGDKTTHFEYNAFGQMLEKTGDADCRFKYTGKLYDNIIGLQWNINRWYDPSVGRWISEDPIGFEAGDANLNRYVGNNIVAVIDPDGLKWKYVSDMGNLSGFLAPGDESMYGKASSDFWLEFNPDRSKFEKKCCDEVRFVQIY